MKKLLLFSCVALSLATTKMITAETISLEAEDVMTKNSHHVHRKHFSSKSSQDVIGPTGPTGATGPRGPRGFRGTAGAIGPRGFRGHAGVTGPTGPASGGGGTGVANTAVFSATYTIGDEIGQPIIDPATPLLFETPVSGTAAINYPATNSPISYSNSGANAGTFTLSAPGIYQIEFSGSIIYNEGTALLATDKLAISLFNTTTVQLIHPAPIFTTAFAYEGFANQYEWSPVPFSASNCVQITTPQSYQMQATFTTDGVSTVGIDNTLLTIILLVPL